MRSPVTRFDQHANATRNKAGLCSLLVLGLVFGLTSGCAKQQEASSASTLDSAAVPGSWWGQDSTHLAFDATRFTNPTQITNEFFPLKPGLQMDYVGTALDDEGEKIDRKMQINVTDLTKMVGGVRCVVSYDLDWSEGPLVEAELALFAQDDAGNVWLMGEYPEEYDDGDGVLTGNPAWFHGVDGAKAGILVPAEAKVTGTTFSQGWSSLVGYSDRGRVDSVGVSTCVPLDCYENLMVVAETSGDEVEVEQLKYYARGVGNVRAHWRGKNDQEHSTFELTKITMLDAKTLAKVRTEALALEKKAIKGNTSYQKTTPIESSHAAKH
jgi:hypothetical protein